MAKYINIYHRLNIYIYEYNLERKKYKFRKKDYFLKEYKKCKVTTEIKKILIYKL